MRNTFFFLFICVWLSPIIFSCQKDTYYTGNDAELKFSADTLSFDTVFTTIGTATKRLMVYNPYNSILKISRITLAGNDHSQFLINVNGIQGTSWNDVEIYPKDSLYLFVQVFINPTGGNLPLLVKDSLQFVTNGKMQDIKLLAYGQDVHLLKDQIIKTSVWTADKPYLLYGDVTVDTLETLTIASGAQLYFHKQANLRIKGSLVAEGGLNTPIRFRGDRTEKEYDDIPGQWGGILFLPGSTNNRLNWCIAENGTTGVKAGSFGTDPGPDVQITNSIIRNMSYNSLLAIDAKIKCVNCVIADAAAYTCGLIGGGSYEFYHCTIADYFGRYSGRDISSPTLQMTNYYADPSNPSSNLSFNLTASFYNSIVYGNSYEEMNIDTKGKAASSYLFDHCLLKSKKYEATNEHFVPGIIWNQDPKFKTKPVMSFELDTLSPAKDNGNMSIGQMYPLDLKGNSRISDKGGPDIGAFERIETTK